MVYFFLVLNLEIVNSNFPTSYVKNNKIDVYKLINTFQQAFKIDILTPENIIKLGDLSQTNRLENNTLFSELVSLITWIIQTFLQLQPDLMPNLYNTNTVTELKWFEKIQLLVNHRLKRNTVSDVTFSIGHNNNFIDKDSVPGCSQSLYGRNKVQCILKFFKLVKTPTNLYVGNDLLTPLIRLTEIPVSPITHRHMHEFAEILGFSINEPLKETFLDKLRIMLASIPTPQYTTAYNTLQSILSTVVVPTSTSSTPLLPTPNSPTLTTLRGPISDDITLLNSIANIYRGMISNEQEIKRLKNQISSESIEKNHFLEFQAGLGNLETSIVNNLHGDELQSKSFNEKLNKVFDILDDLKLADTSVSSNVIEHIDKLSKELTELSTSNNYQIGRHTDDLVALGAEINSLKLGIDSSVQALNQDKEHFQSFVNPLLNLANDLEKINVKIQELEQKNNIFNNNLAHTDNLSLHVLSDQISQILLDMEKLKPSQNSFTSEATDFLLEDLVEEMRQFKLLLTKPQDSTFLREDLSNLKVESLKLFSADQRIIVIEINYFDDKSEEVFFFSNFHL